MGFGSIQQRISERSRDEKLQYDASANINLDKLLPSKSGIKTMENKLITEPIENKRFFKFLLKRL